MTWTMGKTIVRFTRYHGYTVYEDGAVCNPDGSARKLNKNQKGYIQISMKVDGKWTTRHQHKLMYTCFVGEVPDGFEVDHINNIRDDNRLTNFQLLSKSNNNKKSYSSGNRVVSGEANANSVLTDKDVADIRISPLTGVALAKRYRVSATQISRVRRGVQR